MLQWSELGVEALHNAAGAAEHVPLGMAEEAQHLFGSRVSGNRVAKAA